MVLELYAEIDVAGNSFFAYCPFYTLLLHLAIVIVLMYAYQIKMKIVSRTYCQNENEDDDKGKIAYGDSSNLRLNWILCLLQFLLLHPHCILENKFHNKAVSFRIIICIYCDFTRTLS